jgi:hypothetical protein
VIYFSPFVQANTGNTLGIVETTAMKPANRDVSISFALGLWEAALNERCKQTSICLNDFKQSATHVIEYPFHGSVRCFCMSLSSNHVNDHCDLINQSSKHSSIHKFYLKGVARNCYHSLLEGNGIKIAFPCKVNLLNLKPLTRLELVTSPLPRECSTAEL